MKSKARVLLVMPSLTSHRVFFGGVAEGIIRNGGEVAVACGPSVCGEPKDGERETATVLPIPLARATNPLALLRAGIAVSEHVKQWQPTIVHAHFSAGVAVAAIARRLSYRSSARWLGTFHGMYGAGSRTCSGRLVGMVEKISAKQMTEAWVLNREDLPYLQSAIARGRGHVLPGFGVGCDLDIYNPNRFPAEQRTAWRLGHGIAATARVLCYVGRRTKFKGFPNVVRAFLTLAASDPDLYLVIVGPSDPLHANGLQPDEEAAIRATRRIVSLGWQKNVASVLQACDLLLFPSDREGMPVNIMESLAMGVPVVTYDSRGCRDIVRNGDDGLVLQSRESDVLAEAISALFASPPRLKTMRRQALQGRARFDRHVFVDSQLSLYGLTTATGRTAAAECI